MKTTMILIATGLLWACTSSSQRGVDEGTTGSVAGAAEKQMQTGQTMKKKGDGDTGLNSYLKVLQDNPDDVAALQALASGYLQSGEPQLAEAPSRHLVELQPHNPAGHILLADSYRKQDAWIPAILAYSRFLTLEPEGPASPAALNTLVSLMHRETEASAASRADDDFSGVAKAFSAHRAAGAGDKRPVAPRDQLIKEFSMLFAQLHSKGESASRSGFVWKTYAPYFAAMEHARQIPGFVHTIHQSMDKRMMGMQVDHSAVIAGFMAWNKKQ